MGRNKRGNVTKLGGVKAHLLIERDELKQLEFRSQIDVLQKVVHRLLPLAASSAVFEFSDLILRIRLVFCNGTTLMFCWFLSPVKMMDIGVNWQFVSLSVQMMLYATKGIPSEWLTCN